MKPSGDHHLPARKRRVLVLDDHPMTRRGLVQLINSEPDLIVCAEAGSSQEALAVMGRPPPDLILTDISIPGKSGLEFTKDMQTLHPEVRILVLSMHEESVYAERVLRSGARGYVMKTEGGEKLLHAIRRVLEGEIYVSPELSAAIIDAFTHGRSDRAASPLALLTDREFEIFQLLGQGLSTREIGQHLHLSVPTVGTHRMHIKQKLKLETGVQVVQEAIRWGAAQRNS
jgi:DNA-binding NarL/FixJ family response regulator